MLNISNTKCTVWQPESKGNYTKANISTSKKDKDGNWINMSWNAKFVGKANQPIQERQRINIISGIIESRKYQDKWYYDVVIFEFEPIESKNQHQDNISFEVDPSELPF